MVALLSFTALFSIKFTDIVFILVESLQPMNDEGSDDDKCDEAVLADLMEIDSADAQRGMVRPVSFTFSRRPTGIISPCQPTSDITES